MGHSLTYIMQNYKTFRKNIHENLCDLELDKEFLDLTPEANT